MAWSPLRTTPLACHRRRSPRRPRCEAGDVWVTLVKTGKRGMFLKNCVTPPIIYIYVSGRNRDIGTISVSVGYCDVRCLSPLYVSIW